MLNFITKLAFILLILLATLDIREDHFMDKTCVEPRAPQVWLKTERLKGLGFCFLIEALADNNNDRYLLASGG